MPFAQILYRANNRIELWQTIHDNGQHAHQCLFLIAHILCKQRPDARIVLEEMIIEDVSSLVLDRNDLGPAVLDERDLFRCH